ncbi:hypothetical protein AVEN_226134-1 [Araneus ventricosus]|uniref:Uncharacterized protein n=1 Tax=Araneus ventricosus TaxID=182803 RepID=A0A4Y2QNV7_ARAVE|nr:hypothetical protein AVEN_226134-1 [Araneus ventricosus]
MHAANTVCERLEDLANVKWTDTADKQHADASDSRVKRDTVKTLKTFESGFITILFLWLKNYRTSGVVMMKINCHNAREVGITSMTRISFGQINNIKLKRVDKVFSLTVSSAIKVHDEKVPIDPKLLFQRMSILLSPLKMNFKHSSNMN